MPNPKPTCPLARRMISKSSGFSHSRGPGWPQPGTSTPWNPRGSKSLRFRCPRWRCGRTSARERHAARAPRRLRGHASRIGPLRKTNCSCGFGCAAMQRSDPMPCTVPSTSAGEERAQQLGRPVLGVADGAGFRVDLRTDSARRRTAGAASLHDRHGGLLPAPLERLLVPPTMGPKASKTIHRRGTVSRSSLMRPTESASPLQRAALRSVLVVVDVPGGGNLRHDLVRVRLDRVLERTDGFGSMIRVTMARLRPVPAGSASRSSEGGARACPRRSRRRRLRARRRRPRPRPGPRRPRCNRRPWRSWSLRATPRGRSAHRARPGTGQGRKSSSSTESVSFARSPGVGARCSRLRRQVAPPCCGGPAIADRVATLSGLSMMPVFAASAFSRLAGGPVDVVAGLGHSRTAPRRRP